MRSVCAIFLIMLLSVSAAAIDHPEPERVLQMHLRSLTAVDGGTIQATELQQLIDKLREKQLRSGDRAAFVRFLFDRAHRRFLRNYTDYATFSETLRTGTYNCLTGTALYALLLDQLGITYRIIETNYHIFLVAETEDGRVLLEATDRDGGFVEGESNIEARIDQYRQHLPVKNNRAKTYYRYDTDLQREVNLEELTGLLYYNLAVVAYNEKDIAAAIEKLGKSIERYQSPRIGEFAAILQLTITESNLEDQVKQQYGREIQRIRAAAHALSARKR